ncbi:MAG: hypothetical protein RJB24_430 [Candidatus Parcubacteria bacterium]
MQFCGNYTDVPLLFEKMASFEPFFLPPIWAVPDNEIHIVSWFGSRPKEDGGGNLSKIITPGLNFITPGGQLVGAYGTNQFPVYLFRHDTPTPGDYAELELPDITLTAKASILAQIKGMTLREKAKNVYKAHYNAEDQDILQATERILNPYIRLVLQKYTFAEYSSQISNGSNPEDIQISKISPDQLLKSLGLKQSGAQIAKDNNTIPELATMGETILAKLDNIGVELVLINIDDLSLPDSVNEARNQSAVEKAEQQAALDRETARARVIDQQVQNRLKEAEGLLKAVKALSEDKTISDEQAYRALVEIPALKEIVGDKDKFITEGGLSGLLAMLQSK